MNCDEEKRRGEDLNEEDEESKGSHGSLLEATMAELTSTKEELRRAKDNAMQSWLDSRPLIDELERRKSDLRIAETRCSSSDAAISELTSQLDDIYSSIRSKKEELVEARNTINELKRNLDQIGEEIEVNKRDEGEKRTRSELGRVVRVRRQTQRRLRLHLRAVKLESEAVELSRAKAIHHINSSKKENATVQLTHEEYYELIRKAEEKSSIAEWRISASGEKRDRRRNSLMRMEKAKPAKQVIGAEEKRIEVKEEEFGSIRVEEIGIDSQMKNRYHKPLQELMEQSSKRNPAEIKKKKKKKKKPSMLIQIRSFFLRRIMRLFG